MYLLIDKPQQTVPGVNAVEKATALKRDLLDAIERLGDRLPPNTLDQLIDELGGPDCVAEVQSSLRFCSILPVLLHLFITFLFMHSLHDSVFGSSIRRICLFVWTYIVTAIYCECLEQF